MKRLLAFAAVLGLAAPAFGQVPNLATGPTPTLPLPSYFGPQDPSQIQFYLNNLVISLNRTLGLTNPIGTATPNVLVEAASQTGQPIIITVGNAPNQTADANVSIQITPKGNGLLQFGNPTSFVPVAGLAVNPGFVQGGKNPVGMSPVATGYLAFQDWLGRTHYSLAF